MANGKPFDEDLVNCIDCSGTGIRKIAMTDDWGDFEYWHETTCSFCGGTGKFYADTAAELKAEGTWYENNPKGW